MSSATTLGMIAPISNFKESSTEDDEDAFKRKKIEHHPDEKVEFDGINDIACDDKNGDYDDDDYDDYYDDHDDPIGGISVSSGSKKMNFSHSVANTVNKMQAIEAKKRILHTSRDDRATTEQCLDPRTRMMLFKMLSNGILDTIDGCLSTGKEANVYYAKGGKKSCRSDSIEFEDKRNRRERRLFFTHKGNRSLYRRICNQDLQDQYSGFQGSRQIRVWRTSMASWLL